MKTIKCTPLPWLVSAMMLVLASVASAQYEPITVVGAAASSNTAQTATTHSFAYNSGTTGSNRLLLVGISYRNAGSETVSTVTYNGVAMTQVGTVNNTTNTRVYLYRLVNPASGSNALAVTWNSALDQGAVVGAITYSGVNQINPVASLASNTGNNTTPTVVLATPQEGLMFGVVGGRTTSNYVVTTVGATSLWSSRPFSGETSGSGQSRPGGAVTQLTWTGSSATWAAAAVSIVPAGSLPGDDDPCLEATEAKTYYLPFPANETQLRQGLLSAASVNNLTANARTVLAVTIPYPGTIITYDHWEDGYETDITNPLQTTTVVWGDGNTANGFISAYPDDILPPGGNFFFDNTFAWNRTTATIVYDGRDKVYSTANIALSKVSGDPGVFDVQNVKLNVPDTKRFGTGFVLPFGENVTLGSTAAFRYTGLFVRAATNGTLVQLDYDGNGSVDVTSPTLNEGEVWFYNGTGSTPGVAGDVNNANDLKAGAVVTSNFPVGVDLLFGGIDSYGTRNMPVPPERFNGNSYITPVYSTNTDAPVYAFFVNPNPVAITINWTRGGATPGTGNFTVDANNGINFYNMDQAAGYRFASAGGERFTAIAVVDADSAGSTYDWSYNIISEARLSTYNTIAWAPGSSNGSGNYNPIWVTPTANTTLYIKNDGDITGGGTASPCGLAYDTAIPLTALQSTLIYHPTLNDQSGMAVYTCDGTSFAMVWGERPFGGTPTATPAIDVGYTTEPICLVPGVIANDDRVTTLINTPIVISVLNNDASFLGTLNPLSVNTSGLKQPDNGIILINPDGTITYTPNPGFTGEDTFEYRVCLTEFPTTCSTALVTVRVPCASSPGVNIIRGLVYRDVNLNGQANIGEGGQSGIPVQLYRDTNGNGSLDGGEPLLDTQTTGGTGAFEFSVAVPELNFDVYDQFNTNSSPSGNDGTANWVDSWRNLGGALLTGTGNSRVLNNRLEVRNRNAGAYRSVNVDLDCGANAATLSFTYQPESLGAVNRLVFVEVAPSASGPWRTVLTLDQNTAAGASTFSGALLQAEMTTDTTVRFRTNDNIAMADAARGANFDNVRVQWTINDATPDNFIAQLQQPLPAGYAQSSSPAAFAYEFICAGGGNCAATFGLISADLAVVKTVNNPTPPVNTDVVFTLQVTNNGFSNATGVQVSDLLPSGYTYVSSTPPAVYNSGTGVWTIGNLTAGASTSLQITATALDTGTYLNVATVSGNQPDPNLANNTSERSVSPVNRTYAVNDINQTPVNVPVGGNVLVNDFDLEGDNQTVTSATYMNASGTQVALPVGTATPIFGYDRTAAVVAAGSITLNADGSYVYTPALDYTGTVPMTYTVTDDSGLPATDTATLVITVTDDTDWENDPPVAQDDTATTPLNTPVSGDLLVNDSDPDGDPIEPVSARADTDGDGLADDPLVFGTSTPVYGTDAGGSLVVAGNLTVNADGTWTFIPTATFVGTVPGDYTIQDVPGGLTDSATLTIIVLPATGTNTNVANDDANLGPKNVAQTGNILVNDPDPEGNDQTVSLIDSNGDGTPDTAPVAGTPVTITQGGTTIGTLTLDPATGAYTWTPATDYVGTAVIPYTQCDNGTPVACASATLYLTTLDVFNGTYAVNDINQTPVNVPVGGNVLTNDFDLEGDGQTVTAATYLDVATNQVSIVLGAPVAVYGYDRSGVVVPAGTITLNADGSYLYSPALDYTGTVPMTYTVTDDNSTPASDTATLVITVTDDTDFENDPPVAQDDTATTPLNTPVSGDLLVNDSDPDGDPIQPVSARADTDGDGLADDPLVFGTSTPVYGTDAGGSLVVAGNLTVNADGTWTFTPTATFVGTVPGDYTIQDVPGGLTDSATLTIIVLPDTNTNTNVANDDANLGPKNVAQTGNILVNDPDPELDDQTVSLIDSDGDGTPDTAPVAGTPVTITQGGTTIGTLTLDPATGAYTWTPATDYVGTAVIPYTQCDDGTPVACASATLYLTTLDVFNGTYAVNDINQTPVNVPVGGNVLTNDYDLEGDGQTVTAATYMNAAGTQVALPVGTATPIFGYDRTAAVVAAGSITLNADGSYVYSPALDYTGTVPMTYTVTDDNSTPATDTATLVITVTDDTDFENDPPVAQDDTATTPLNTPVSGDLLVNDSDPDGDPIEPVSARADTDGDGLADDPLVFGTSTPVYGTDAGGSLVVAGNLTVNADGTWTFIPTATFVGTVPGDYTIQDVPGGLTDSATLTIIVLPDTGTNTNVANDDANLGPKNVAQTGNILVNDPDPEGDDQTVSQIDSDGDGTPDTAPVAGVPVTITQGGTPIGTLTLDPATGAYTWTPATDYVGTAVIPYEQCDDGSPVACASATLYLTTLDVFNGTYAVNDINQTPVNVPVGGNVLTNDYDLEGDGQTVTSATYMDVATNQVSLALGTPTAIHGYDRDGNIVPAGTITLNADGSYLYSPALDYTGTVPLTYTVTDDNASPATDTATLVITVTDDTDFENDPPVAQDDTATTPLNTPVSGDLLVNDSDPDGDPIQPVSARADTDGDGLADDPLVFGTPTPVYGTDIGGSLVVAGNLTVNADGTWLFTPTATFVGTVPGDYTIQDIPGGLTDSATLTIIVLPDTGTNTNVANDDANLGPKNVAQTGNILVNDPDPEGDDQTVSQIDSDGDGTPDTAPVAGVPVTITQGGTPIGTLTLDPATGAYTWTPATDYVGTAVIPYEQCDDGSPVACASATLYLTTLDVFNGTYAVNDINQTPVNVPVGGNVLTNDYDLEGDGQTVTSATYMDVATNQVSLALGTPTAIHGYDRDGNIVPAGTITLNADGSYVYTPALDYTGTVPMTYTLTDDNSTPASDTATLVITVTDDTDFENDPPVAQDDTATTPLNTPVSGDLLVNDSDPDGDPIQPVSARADTDGDGLADDPLVFGTSTPVYGTDAGGSLVVAGNLTVNADGTWTFTPTATFVGTVPGDYTIADVPGGLTDSATLTIIVLPDTGTNTNVANDDANLGPKNVALTGNILVNDPDPEGNDQTVSLIDSNGDGTPDTAPVAGTPVTITQGGTPIGTLTLDPATGAYTWTPATDYVGTAVIPYEQCDDGTPVACASATLYLTTLDVFNGTYAVNDINQTPVNVPVGGNVLTNDYDLEGDNQTVTAATHMDASGAQVALSVGTATPIFGYDRSGAIVPAGTITLNADGSYLYSPALDYTGTVPMTYTVTDDNASPATDTATLTIVVTTDTSRENDPPVAQDDTATTPLNTPVSGDLLVNDSDPDGDPIQPVSARADTDGDGLADDALTFGTSTPVYGTNAGGSLVVAGDLTVNADGTWTFTPTATFVGTVPGDYTIADVPGGLTDSATLTIIVLPDTGTNTNVANDDANLGPKNVAQTGNILVNDPDPEGNDQTVSLIDSDGDGTPDTAPVAGVPVTITQGGTPIGTLTLDPATGAYTWAPATDYVGTAVIPYEQCDDGSPVACASATLYLTTLELVPDITPVITAEPNIMNGPTDFNIRVQVVELNGADTQGTIVLRIPKDSRWTLREPYDSGLTILDGVPMENSKWTYSETPTQHIFTTVNPSIFIPAGGFSYFGIKARWDSAASEGIYTITVQIDSGSGNENRIDNNADAEKIDFFDL